MATIDYLTILMQAFDDYDGLLKDRQNLDLELAKKRQFIKATLNMLDDNDKECFSSIFDDIGGELGLTDAIRKVLQKESKKSFTATEVRDKLKESNFDFSSYKTNPLASIHAILKRLKPEEVEGTDIDGVAAWRWVGEPGPNHDQWVKWVEDRMVTFDPTKPNNPPMTINWKADNELRAAGSTLPNKFAHATGVVANSRKKPKD